MDSNETLALALASDRKALRKRLQETVSVLRRDRYAKFFQRQHLRFSFEEKRLYGADGFFLQWKLRSDPAQPESYENQQTSVGTVELDRVRA